MYPQFLRRAAAAAVALSILALSACGGSDDSSAGSQRAPKEVKIATIGSYLTIFSAMWAAQPGFDKIEKDFGTKISFQSFGKGADAMSAMLGGSVNVNAGTSSPDTVQAVLKGQDMVSIASLFTGPGLVFVGAKKLEKSHGTDIKAYDGATWATRPRARRPDQRAEGRGAQRPELGPSEGVALVDCCLRARAPHGTGGHRRHGLHVRRNRDHQRLGL